MTTHRRAGASPMVHWQNTNARESTAAHPNSDGCHRSNQWNLGTPLVYTGPSAARPLFSIDGLDWNLGLALPHPAAILTDMKTFRQACLLTAIFLSTSEAQEIWTHRYSSPTNDGAQLIIGKPSLYLVKTYADRNSYLRSADGINWNPVSLNFAQHMAITPTGIIGAGYEGIWTTVDGANSNSSWINTFQEEFDVTGIASGNGCWIITTAGGKIVRATSPTGPWVPQLSPTGSIGGIAFGNGIFLATGTNGVVLRSTDGIQWTKTQFYSWGGIKGFSNGTFYNFHQFSKDSGATWNDCIIQNISQQFISHGSDGFMAAFGGDQLYTSPDLITWTAREPGITSVTTVAFCGDLWVAGSSAGRITTSPFTGAVPLTAPPLTIVPAVELKWPSITGRRYQIQSSTNNSTWADVGMAMLGNGSELRLTAPATDARKFFRVEVR